MKVEQYGSPEEFEKDLDKKRGLGWGLHSWRMASVVIGDEVGVVIVAVYSGRS